MKPLPPTTEDRPAARSAMRLRGDLHWARVPGDPALAGDAADRWRVKDPVSLEYHEFGAEEHFLLRQFDGVATPAEIRRRYADRFTPRTLRPEQLEQFAADAHRKGLLIADGSQQAAAAIARGDGVRRRAWFVRATSVLFARLPGIDPGPILRVLTPLTGWVFSPLFAAIVAVAGVATLLLLIANAGALATRLPAAESVLSGGNALGLLAAFVVVKVVHELAHGVACHRVGARCHEVGVLLIALIPCLYCDVTDAWMVRSRRRRMMVSAAGMYAELIIAIGCAWLWAFAADGVVAAVLLNVMIACGVSTLVFNANPLLKLDGYYLLSDAIGAPNLHERARRALFGPIGRWFRQPSARRGRQALNHPLAVFGAASLVYRAVVLVVIAAAAYRVLASWGAGPLGDVLVTLTAAGMATPALVGLAATLRSPIGRRTWKWDRVAWATVAAAVLVAALLAAPIPRTVVAPASLEVADTRPVPAVVPGTLVWAAEEGQRVAAGDPIARLANADLQRRRIRLAAEAERLQTQAASLRKRADRRPSLLAQLPTASAAADQARRDLRQLDAEIARLTITAPIAGVVVGRTPLQSPLDEGRSPRWQGRLVDSENLGSWVAAGDVLCLVAPDLDRLTATLAIDPADALGVRPGLPTRLLAYQSAGPITRAPLGEVARAEGRRLPGGLAYHPEVPSMAPDPAPNPSSAAPQRGPLLLARIDLPAGQMPGVRHGSLARCKIELGREPLGVSFYRWLAGVFPFVF